LSPVFALGPQFIRSGERVSEIVNVGHLGAEEGKSAGVSGAMVSNAPDVRDALKSRA